MMRAYNHNITPGFTPYMASFLSWGPPGLVIPVTLRPDPANPARCQSVFAIDEERTGGGTLTVWAKGAAPLSVDMNVPPLSPDGIEGVSLEMVAAGVDPFKIPTDELRAFRGSIWTARAPMPYGPRPGDPSNILSMDFFESFTPDQQAQMIAGYVGQRRYKHCPVGSFVDGGYHGLYPPIDFRANPAPYAAILQQLWNAGAYPVLFLSPDNWSLEDCERELTPIFSRPEWQRVVRLAIPYGWEPGGYNISNADWVARFAWARRVFPNAILGIHMIADFDAPIGGNDGAPVGTMTKQEAWTNVATAGCSFFLDQVAGYINGPEVPTPEFLSEYAKRVQYFVQHFQDWGLGIDYIAGEYAAYADFWKNYGERYAVQIGDLAMASGARGFFDGGTA